MVRTKQTCRKSLKPTDDSSVLPDSQEARVAVQSVGLTQLVDLAQPENSDITAKFAPGSKYFSFVYPGNGSLHIGHAPRPPPVRSDIYKEHEELIGKKYAMSTAELDKVLPGIIRRWKKVRMLACGALRFTFRSSRMRRTGISTIVARRTRTEALFERRCCTTRTLSRWLQTGLESDCVCF